MRLFPIALDLNGQRALVIGADGDAPYTVERLLSAGARVSVVAPGQVDGSIEQASREGRLDLHRRAFLEGDLAGAAIVFLVPGDEALSRRLHRELAGAGRLVCTLDRPEASNFANPSVVSASGLTMSFSSHGVSPGTIRRIREDLSALFSDPRFARYIEALRRLRESLPRGPERAARMRRATLGFGLEARLRFPEWLERGDEP
ncbi:NAD(P)-dependent oxidoreductase [Sorangium sp. So ce448]|uniref:precorrin-2 dehydrogenase/sirohydrochlorin ferrochelatase family protein n=1 Tax=Sorangium sp. So ce448 TaxID=3133314 RepID=UPI003F5E48FF